MPVTVKPNASENGRHLCSTELCANISAGCLEKTSRSLHIGLINNMSDAALEATERQFISLLDAASGDFSVSLSLYSLRGISRSGTAQKYVDQHYQSVESLWTTELDGLIVTGREPLTSNLCDEPYWDSFGQVLEWARERTRSTIWSCLAAHAAVLNMDGIQRVRSAKKHSGIIDCVLASDHLITANLPTRFRIPHSRWNGLKEEDLAACGYEVITRTADASVDAFIKGQKSIFVFFQGHPEYEANALLLEYRRDIGRYVRGESNDYPLIPRGYFDPGTEKELTDLEYRVKTASRAESLEEASRILESVRILDSWRSTAVCIYRNWLQLMSQRKMQQLQSTAVANGPDQLSTYGDSRVLIPATMPDQIERLRRHAIS